MKRYLNTSTLAIVLGLVCIVCASLVQSVYAAYVAPLANPPFGNVDGPINLSQEFQNITGGLQADTIGVDYGIDLAGVSMLDWPTPVGTAVCHLEVKRVDWKAGSRSFEWDSGIAGASMYPTCDQYLTSSAVSAGWASTGVDNCLGTTGGSCDDTAPSPDDSAPHSSCMYTRLVCTPGATSPGITVEIPTKGYMVYDGISNGGLYITLPTTNPY